MTNLMRYDPFSESFDDVVRSFLRPTTWRPAQRELQVPMNVVETPQAYVVKAEVPGVKKEDIHVQIDGARVSITAEYKTEKEVKEGERVVLSERYTGKAYRAFTLGQEVDEGNASARYADGILELTLPKKAATGARKLAIS